MSTRCLRMLLLAASVDLACTGNAAPPPSPQQQQHDPFLDELHQSIAALEAQSTSRDGGGLRVIGAGQGTTGTHSLFVELCGMGVGAWHWAIVCNNKAKPGKPGDDPGAPRHFALPPRFADLAAGQTLDELAHESRQVAWGAVHALFRGNHEAFLDTPAGYLFDELLAAFPRAAVALTTRNGSEWAARRLADHGGSLLCRESVWPTNEFPERYPPAALTPSGGPRDYPPLPHAFALRACATRAAGRAAVAASLGAAAAAAGAGAFGAAGTATSAAPVASSFELTSSATNQVGAAGATVSPFVTVADVVAAGGTGARPSGAGGGAGGVAGGGRTLKAQKKSDGSGGIDGPGSGGVGAGSSQGLATVARLFEAYNDYVREAVRGDPRGGSSAPSGGRTGGRGSGSSNGRPFFELDMWRGDACKAHAGLEALLRTQPPPPPSSSVPVSLASPSGSSLLATAEPQADLAASPTSSPQAWGVLEPGLRSRYFGARVGLEVHGKLVEPCPGPDTTATGTGTDNDGGGGDVGNVGSGGSSSGDGKHAATAAAKAAHEALAAERRAAKAEAKAGHLEAHQGAAAHAAAVK